MNICEAKRYDCGEHGLLTVKQIAALVGVCESTIYQRTRSGIRGADLLAPAMPKHEAHARAKAACLKVYRDACTARSHWVVDGAPYPSAPAVFRAACARGFTGEYTAIYNRLMRGDCTWQRLLRPIDERLSAGKKTSARKKRDEMAAVIAALDARKKEMGL